MGKAQPFVPSAPITDVTRESALKAALRSLPKGHYGGAHPSGQSFRYEPSGCPGCVHSVVHAMLEDLRA